MLPELQSGIILFILLFAAPEEPTCPECDVCPEPVVCPECQECPEPVACPEPVECPTPRQIKIAVHPFQSPWILTLSKNLYNPTW